MSVLCLHTLVRGWDFLLSASSASAQTWLAAIKQSSSVLGLTRKFWKWAGDCFRFLARASLTLPSELSMIVWIFGSSPSLASLWWSEILLMLRWQQADGPHHLITSVTCHSPPFSPLIGQFCGNQALWLVKAAMIPVLWLAVTRTDCYLVTGSPGQTRCHGRATREQQLGENIFLSKPLRCILQNASKWILFFSKIILNVNLSLKFLIERATPGKYLVNQNSMSCSKCLFCNLKARSISNPRLSWTFTSQSWLVREERKVTLWLGLGSEQRCNFTNYPPIDLVSYLLPTGPQSATSSREPESWRQAMSGT